MNTHNNCHALCAWLLVLFSLVLSPASIADIVNRITIDRLCLDPDDDGFGWNGTDTCPPFVESSQYQTARLVPDNEDLIEFAIDLHTDGDQMIVVGKSNLNYATNNHHAYILQRQQPGEWTVDTILDPNAPATLAGELKVAIDGNIAVVAAPDAVVTTPTNSDELLTSGFVNVYHRGTDGAWRLETQLTNTEIQWARYGVQVALDGNTLMISYSEGTDFYTRNPEGLWERSGEFEEYTLLDGMKIDDDVAISPGHYSGPYIYEKNSDGLWVTGPTLVPSDRPITGWLRQFAVAIDQDVAVLGDYYDRVVECPPQAITCNTANHGHATGSAYVFRRTENDQWNLEAQLVASEASVENFFGRSVDVAGDRIAIGSNNGTYMFRYSNGAWNQESRIKSSVDDGARGFGNVLTLSNNSQDDSILTIGSRNYFGRGIEPGSVHVYEFPKTDSGISVVAPGSTSSCIDTDGDGWGWDGLQSCRITDSNQPTCIDSDGDGWGWDGSQSCVVENTINNMQDVIACEGTEVDHDGDGWGWENGQSCRTEKTKRQIRVSFTLPPELIYRQQVSAGIGLLDAFWGHSISDVPPFKVTRQNPISVPFDANTEIHLIAFAAPGRNSINSTYIAVARYRRPLPPGTTDVTYNLTADDFDLTLDDDYDGKTNLAEVLAGTDPRTPD